MLRMKRCCVFLLLAAWAGAMMTGCDDKSGDDPVTPPEPIVPEKLATPQVSVSEVAVTSFKAVWAAVPHAAGYAYALYASAGGTQTKVKEDAAYAKTEVLFEGLTAATDYVLKVQALSADGAAEYLDSDFGSATATTQANPVEVTSPWVDIRLECVLLGDKLAVQVTNTPNSKCVHYYLSTENVNVIGDGLASEAELIGYLLEDFEYGEPGVYQDKQILTCNNNGSGLTAGQKLFYHVVGEDASGKTGALNWVWFQVPEKAGDEVIVLDGPDKQTAAEH